MAAAIDHDEVLVCAKWAQMAYSDTAWASVSGAQCFSDPATDCQCYMVPAQGEGPAFVVFRGTSSFQDALEDANVALVSYMPGRAARVHAGFMAQVEAVIADVRQALAGQDGEVRCTGHSLGAAAAMLCSGLLAAEYEDDPDRPVSFVGFGSPRAGDAEWKRVFESLVTRAVRVKNGRDPVAGIPEGGGYVHAGSEEHVGRADPHPDLPSIANLADHDVTTGYVKNCTADDPAAKGQPVAEYVLMFLANRLALMAKGSEK